MRALLLVLLAATLSLAGCTCGSDPNGLGSATRLAFTVQPTHTVAGAALAPAVQVTLLRTDGKTATDATAAITLSPGPGAPAGATVEGTRTVSAVRGVATFADVHLPRAGTGYTLVARVNGLTEVQSQAFDVEVGPPAQLGFPVAPGEGRAGGVLPPVEVEVQDAQGNATGTDAEVHLALGTAPAAPMLAPATLSGTTVLRTVAGRARFTEVSLDRAGEGFTLVASAAGLAPGESAPFRVRAGAPVRLGFVALPATAVAGEPLAPAVQVAVQDTYGNTVDDASATVTLALASGPGPLQGTLTAATAAGVASFADLSLETVATGDTLGASAEGLTSATSAPFDVVPGPPARLVVVEGPERALVGATLAPALRVRVEDARGNLATHARLDVGVALSGGPAGARLSGTLTAPALDGVATFDNLAVDTPGSGYVLNASAQGAAGASSATFDIDAGGLALVYVEPPTGGLVRVVRNAASTPTLAVLDVVTAAPLTGYAVGMNLPLDTTRVQAASPLLVPGAALPAGSAPAAAGAALPTGGPLAGVLVSGQSQKASGSGAVATDTAVPAGAVLYTLRLSLRGGTSPGLVFDGAAPGPRFRAALKDKLGNDVVGPGGFAVGRLEVR